MRELRVCFGSEGDRRSCVWKLWTHGSEIYLLSRMMGSSTKVSLHSNGQGQWSMNSEWYGQQRPNQPNSRRHIVRWSWNPPTDRTASHVFRLSVPESELRVITIPEDLREVLWLGPPAIGSTGNVDCYVFPGSPDQAALARPEALSALELDGGMSVVIVLSYSPVSDADRIQLNNARTEAASQAAAACIVANPGFRSAALFRINSDVQGMVEFVPFEPAI